ncbi:MAG: CDGSH iron-sulfur domain-containing protein, partial [Alphaproteobacteria bacterium]
YKMFMSENMPKIYSLKSIKFQVEKGKKYYWCSCGLSANQPLCDGSHIGTEFAPLEYLSDADKIIGFCGCKHSKTAPLCDGAHNLLTPVDIK